MFGIDLQVVPPVVINIKVTNILWLQCLEHTSLGLWDIWIVVDGWGSITCWTTLWFVWMLVNTIKSPWEQVKQASKLIKLAYGDIYETMATFSLWGAKWFITFVDDFSHFLWIYTIQSKDEVFEEFKSSTKNQSRRQLNVLGTCKGEYASGGFQAFLKSCVICWHNIVLYNPHPKWSSWTKKLKFYRDGSMNSCVVQGLILYEKWYGNEHSISHFRIFGSSAWAHISIWDKFINV